MIVRLRTYLAHLRWWYEQERPVIGRLGWQTYLAWTLPPLLGPIGNGKVRRVRLPGYDRPIHIRHGSSDFDVVRQVFYEQEYACVVGLPNVEFIADCGANVGFTTFFLLHHYPQARAVVVEPDPGNMAACRRNLSPFAGRVTFVPAGIWSADTPVVVERGDFRDGREWSFHLRPAKPGETADFTAVTIADLLRQSGFSRFDILKIDIEAAEAEVFRADTSWLSKVKNLVIELHGPDCEAAVQAALNRYQSDVSTSGELTLYQGITFV